MFVRSEDGTRIDSLDREGGLDIYQGYPKADTWEITGRGQLATFATKEDALARLDDVVAWLNAPILLSFGEFDEDDEITPAIRKPRVYEFAKPLGFWKGVS